MFRIKAGSFALPNISRQMAPRISNSVVPGIAKPKSEANDEGCEVRISIMI